MPTKKLDQFAGVLGISVVTVNYTARLAFIFLVMAARAMAGDSAPAKIKIDVNVVPAVLATKADCRSQGQSMHAETLTTFILPVEPWYECIEDRQDIQIDLIKKTTTSRDIATPASPRAFVIRHTYVPR